MSDQEYEDLPTTPALQLLAAIDAEQNALLEQLDALNSRIEQVLHTCVTQQTENLSEQLLKRAA